MSAIGDRIRRCDRRTWLLVALLLGSGGAYLALLGRQGWSNGFYSAAAQAGAQSWQAFLFGASDAPGTITVDKPPLALWPMALSVKLFGLSTWSILVPQALMGVASVGLLYVVVRRSFGVDAGLIAALALATTPIALVMFRHNNPDAILVLLEIGATGAMLEAVRRSGEGAWSRGGSGWWLLASGALVGLGFLAKQLAVFLVVPALALVWLVGARPKLLTRISLSFVALAGLVVSAGWWVALVELWRPKESRPWIGGSQTNSFLELTFGYNGLGRINGDEHGGGLGSPGEGFPKLGEGCFGGGPGRGMFAADRGILRMFGEQVGGQIAWLLPAALVLLAASLFWIGRAARTDQRRAGLLAWGGWLVVTALVFSFMGGIFHPYYSVALAPALAALTGAGLTMAWERRGERSARLVLASATLAASGMAWAILSRTPDWLPPLRWAIA